MAQKSVLVLGAGKIGTLITFLLAKSNDYLVYLADIQPNNPQLKYLKDLEHFKYLTVDATDETAIKNYIKQYKIEALVSSLPFYCNSKIAQIAASENLHYFDLTEDVETSNFIEELAKNSKRAFVPQCGLAPGFISIVANDLMQHFSSLTRVKMRVGALPINISNPLQYALTWSTDGLINEYGNPCQAVRNGKLIDAMPLNNLEEIIIDGLRYEAFNTSGGIGSLAKTYSGKVQELNYKTIRYPGHCKKMKFLMDELGLNYRREILKQILEDVIPQTHQDVVIVYVSVTGHKSKGGFEENFVKKFYPHNLHGQTWTAIQLTTASGLCTVLDIVLNNPTNYQGFIRQEQFSYQAITENQFGHYYLQ